jgi:Mycobacterium membrane protein
MRRSAVSLLAVLVIAGCNVNSNAAHTVQYEVTGPAATANITYLDANGAVKNVTGAAIPWEYYFTAMGGASVSVSATLTGVLTPTVTIYEGTFGRPKSVFQTSTSATTAAASGTL